MPDLRPILFVIGIMLSALGVAMFAPMFVDMAYGASDWKVFAISGAFTTLTGVSLAIANQTFGADLRIRGAFLLTTLSWVLMSVFSAIPFFLAQLNLSITDSLFEAVSGITTTGSTVIVGR